MKIIMRDIYYIFKNGEYLKQVGYKQSNDIIRGRRLSDIESNWIENNNFCCSNFNEIFSVDGIDYHLIACEYEARTELYDRGLYYTWKCNKFMPDGFIWVHPIDWPLSNSFAICLRRELIQRYSELYGYSINWKKVKDEISSCHYSADRWIEEWEQRQPDEIYKSSEVRNEKQPRIFV